MWPKEAETQVISIANLLGSGPDEDETDVGRAFRQVWMVRLKGGAVSTKLLRGSSDENGTAYDLCALA